MHIAAQRPLVQTPESQKLWQAPQLAASLSRSAQNPPQSVSPSLQMSATHVPWWQEFPRLQELKPMSQCSPLANRATQTPRQSVNPGPQLTPQTKSRQTPPRAQELKQAPQCPAWDEVSTHSPPHASSPAGHPAGG